MAKSVKITALPPPGTKGLLNVRQAAAYLNIGVGTLRNWMSDHRIAYVKVGRLSHFRQADLDAFIEAHLVRAVASNDR
jgi:excisionase family DNA binding protein